MLSDAIAPPFPRALLVGSAMKAMFIIAAVSINRKGAGHHSDSSVARRRNHPSNRDYRLQQRHQCELLADDLLALNWTLSPTERKQKALRCSIQCENDGKMPVKERRRVLREKLIHLPYLPVLAGESVGHMERKAEDEIGKGRAAFLDSGAGWSIP